MWKEFFEDLNIDFTFEKGCSLESIIEAEKILGCEFSDKLKSILYESNGIEYGEWKDYIIWPLENILKENLEFRNTDIFKEIYMSFDGLLFFADAGNGDLFAYPIQNGKIDKEDIFVWNHEDDSRRWVTSSIENFFKGWIDGTISI